MMKQRQKTSSWKQNNYKKLDKESGSDDDETELFIRNKPKRKEIETIEKIVEDSDTLQSIAIRYHCTIEDLKRINNIHKENEIFAKPTIKVPKRPFSMALVEVHSGGTNSPKECLPSSSKTEDLTTFNAKLSDNLNNIPKENGSEEVNYIIFNTNIKKTVVENIDHHSIEQINEDVRLLPQSVPTSANQMVSKLNCSGSDFGISWIGLVVCIIILIFAVPLILVFYIAEHPEKYHHQQIG